MNFRESSRGISSGISERKFSNYLTDFFFHECSSSIPPDGRLDRIPSLRSEENTYRTMPGGEESDQNMELEKLFKKSSKDECVNSTTNSVDIIFRNFI